LGGQRGPDLDAVATRLTIDQMRFKVVTGGGNMPAYGKNLSPPEIEALVSFLDTLHPANEPPAYDASRRTVDASQPANSTAPASAPHANSGTTP
jgi:ubiquinol-cytochrome c reductase cytochrome b subunit